MAPSRPRPVTVVAVHGNGGGGRRFARVRRHLPADVTLLAPTLPGFGGVPDEAGLDSVRAYADRLAAVVAAARPAGGAGGLVLLGHGVGGTFVLDLLQRHADAVDAVVLHAPVGARLDTRLVPRLLRLPGAARVVQAGIASPATRPLLARLAFPAVREGRPDAEPVAGRERREFFTDYARSAAFAKMWHMIDDAWFATLEPVDVAAALLWGAKERVLAVDQVDDYRRLLPRATVRRVEGWDHFPMLEQPVGYAREVVALARQLTA